MKRRIIGIDVGKNGGIVVYDTENNKLLECIKMPPTPKDLLDFLSIYKENSVCYLERVNGMTGQSASASFVFGEGYGQLTMGLIACGIPTVTVSPQTWQKTIGLRNTDKLGKTEWKNILNPALYCSRIFVSSLYPGCTVVSGKGDPEDKQGACRHTAL